MKTATRFLLSAALAVLLVALLTWWGGVEWSDVAATCRRLTLGPFLAAFAVHLGIHGLRAERFRALIPRAERPDWLPTVCAASAHNLAAYVLPAKTGELAFPLYMKAHCRVRTETALAALLVSRLLDLSTLCFWLACASSWLALDRPAARPLFCGTALCLFVAAALLWLLALRSELLHRWAEGLARLAGLERTRVGAKLLDRARSLGGALQAASRESLRLAAVQSLAMWVGIFLFYAILARGFGIGEAIGLVEAAFGSSLAVLSNLLPINSLAGFGTQEAGWVVGFGMLGVERELALATGLGVHVVQLVNTVILGLAGHAGMGLFRREH